MKSFYTIALLFFSPFLTFSQIGNPAPDFTVTDTHGETHRLYDYLEAGKVVVLDFFYTTCGPCQYYSPQVNLAYEKYGCNTGEVIFIAIDYNDSDAEVLAYDAQYQIQYPSVSGLNGGGNSVVNLYQILAFPTFYVIDSTKSIIEQISPPTLQVFDYRFQQHGIQPADCNLSSSNDLKNFEKPALFPNPFVSGMNLNVRLVNPSQHFERYDVFDFSGRKVLSKEINLDKSQNLEVRTAHLPAGIYSLMFLSEENIPVFSELFVIE